MICGFRVCVWNFRWFRNSGATGLVPEVNVQYKRCTIPQVAESREFGPAVCARAKTYNHETLCVQYDRGSQYLLHTLAYNHRTHVYTVILAFHFS